MTKRWLVLPSDAGKFSARAAVWRVSARISGEHFRRKRLPNCLRTSNISHLLSGNSGPWDRLGGHVCGGGRNRKPAKAVGDHEGASISVKCLLRLDGSVKFSRTLRVLPTALVP